VGRVELAALQEVVKGTVAREGVAVVAAGLVAAPKEGAHVELAVLGER
jgi:hypothetical protein